MLDKNNLAASIPNELRQHEKTIIPIQASLKAPPKRLRVAAYARVSSGKDAMLHSLSAQVSYYSDLIQANPGWEYCGVYADADTPYGLNLKSP